MGRFSKDKGNLGEIMNQERIKIYYDLMKLGLNFESIKLFPGTVNIFTRMDRACFIMETSRGKYALWLVSGEEQRLQDGLRLLQLLKESQIEGFLYPVQLKDGSFYGVIKEGGYFYLTKWPELRGVSYRKDLNSLLNLIVNFRKVLNSCDLSVFKTKTSPMSLINHFQDMIKAMKSFALLAEYRLNPTGFDQLYRRNWKGFVAEAEFALELLRSSAYRKLSAAKESLRPIINNFSRRNLRAFANGRVVCLNIKDSSMDMPIMDLALLMVKTGRANRWSREWHDHIIEKYNEKFLLTDEEIEIIRAYLAFPWEAYRLAARYYYNRVNWPVSVFVEKMERILKSNEDREILFKYLIK